MTSPAVRPVEPRDAQPLAELLNAIIAQGGTTALEEPFTAERLAQTYLDGPDVLCCHVAVDAATGELGGFQTLCREADLAEGWGDIGTFARLGGQQRGVGRALFAATRERVRELGLVAINATIRADNYGGLTFYGQLGFEDYDVIRAAPLNDGTPVDRIRKRYALRPAAAATDRMLEEVMN